MKKNFVIIGLFCSFLSASTLFAADLIRDKHEIGRYQLALRELHQSLSKKAGKALPPFRFTPQAGRTPSGIIISANTKLSNTSREVIFDRIYTPFGQSPIFGLNHEELMNVSSQILDEKGTSLVSVTNKVDFFRPIKVASCFGSRTMYVTGKWSFNPIDLVVDEEEDEVIVNQDDPANRYDVKAYLLVKIGQFSDEALLSKTTKGREKFKIYQILARSSKQMALDEENTALVPYMSE